MKQIFYLWFDPNDGRYQRGKYGLHCGDCVEVLINEDVVATRIEHSSDVTHSHGWFLVSHPNLPLDGLPVLKEGA